MTMDKLKTISVTQLNDIWDALDKKTKKLSISFYRHILLKKTADALKQILDHPNEIGTSRTKTYQDAFDVSHILEFLRLADKQRPEDPSGNRKDATSINLSGIDELVRSCCDPFWPNQTILPVYFQDKYLGRPQLAVPLLIVPNYVDPGPDGDRGEKQADWIGVAHEVGHFIYRGIPNLREELEVALARKFQEKIIKYHEMGTSEDVDTPLSQRRLWLNYLEEAFADLVGILSFGAAFVYSQHVMILSSALSYTYSDPPSGSISSVVDYGKLLVATDFTHPIPFIRGSLGVMIYGYLVKDITPNKLFDLHKEWQEVLGEIEKLRDFEKKDPGNARSFLMGDPHTPKSPLLKDTDCYPANASDPDKKLYGKLIYSETVGTMANVVHCLLETKLRSLGNQSLHDLVKVSFQDDENARNETDAKKIIGTVKDRRDLKRNQVAISYLTKYSLL